MLRQPSCVNIKLTLTRILGKLSKNQKPYFQISILRYFDGHTRTLWFSFNHWDSYPTGLGVDIIRQLKKAIDKGCLEEWKTKLSLMEWSCSNPDPRPSQSNLKKGELTNLEEMLNGRICSSEYGEGHMQKVGDWNEIEYSYVINFDDTALDFYKYGYGLIGRFPFNMSLPNPKIVDEYYDLLVGHHYVVDSISNERVLDISKKR